MFPLSAQDKLPSGRVHTGCHGSRSRLQQIRTGGCGFFPRDRANSSRSPGRSSPAPRFRW